MAVIISKADVNWGEAFHGFVPSKALVSSEGLYNCTSYSRDALRRPLIFTTIAIGILGATVMPHSLFLGSAFATQEREKPAVSALEEELALTKAETKDSGNTSSMSSLPFSASSRPWYRCWSMRGLYLHSVRSIRACFAVMRMEPESEEVKSHTEWKNHSLAFVSKHLYHGIVDMVMSLLGLAVVINAL